MSVSPVIDVDNLKDIHCGSPAVKNFSFPVARGERYALLGTNGAGKISTLEVIEGHHKASSSALRVLGHSPTHLRSVRPRVGIMLQESDFFPDLTVRELVQLISRLTKRENNVARVLRIVEITHRAVTLVSQLSGGESRMLDFATAVYGRPELIIFDGPTTGLDIQARDALWAAVEDLREDGSTIVLTTHYYLEEAQRSLSPGAPAPPTESAAVSGQSYFIKSFNAQTALKQLLDWVNGHTVELIGLSAAPTRLDDVFRAIDAGAAAEL